MRGRTLNDAFIILDEAQNTTPEQMKMFLTRLGFGSKIVVTGDVTQVDLPGGTTSGLRVVREILDGVDDVHFAELTSADVVRHRLVGDIVDAYARWDADAGAAGHAAVHAVPGRPPAVARAGPPALSRGAMHHMSIEIANESGVEVDTDAILAVARHALDEMGVNPLAELSVLLVDVDYMTELNQRWMGGDGPTDVLAFPMDEGSVDHGPGEAERRRAGAARRHRAVPGGGGQAGRRRRAHRRRRAAPAHRARRAAPARLRPRRAGGGARDVRACRRKLLDSWRAGRGPADRRPALIAADRHDLRC